jgi:hypothetical protein
MREVAERNAGLASEQGSNAGSPQSALIGGFIVSVTVFYILLDIPDLPLSGSGTRNHKT